MLDLSWQFRALGPRPGPKHVAALALGGPAKARPACLGHRCGSLVRGCDEGGRPQARCQETQLHP